MSSEIIPLGARELDRTRNVLRAGGVETAISPLACRFLLVLAETPGEIVSRETLVERLWDGNALVGEPALNRVVSELRKAAGDAARTPTLVQTIPRKGYRLVSARGEGTPPPALPPGWSWQKIAVLGVIVVLGVGLLSWLLDSLTGLIWMIQHPAG